VVIVGAGHSGLAMSRCLSARSIDHVVLERGEVAHAWRSQRWDSLRLLTPNWLCRLPGQGYEGSDPDGYLDAPGVVRFIERYARAIGAPVITSATVSAVRGVAGGEYRVESTAGNFRCRALVLANGAFSVPFVPAAATEVPPGIVTITPDRYRNPGQLPPGGVLVVGASATGLQLADEIHASGRPVTLAVGEHVRMPRVHRGRDIQWWMLEAGLLDQRWNEVDDIVRARRVPSPQLIGTPERRTLDLNTLGSKGVRLAGRFAGIAHGRARFSGSLANVCKLADLKMSRLLAALDTSAGIAADAQTEPTRVPDRPLLDLDLSSGEIGTILWATGSRPDYSWLGLDVLDRKGRLRHDGGVVEAPGLYAMGLTFMRRRKSSFIHGAADDAGDLAAHIAGYLGNARRRTPSVAAG
jgi:putative flavoprotein involved in K+ transport